MKAMKYPSKVFSSILIPQTEHQYYSAYLKGFNFEEKKLHKIDSKKKTDQYLNKPEEILIERHEEKEGKSKGADYQGEIRGQNFFNWMRKGR